MENSRLIKILSTFTKSEMKNFDKFIVSPYFSKERNFEPLLNILKKFHPEYDNPVLNEEYIFRKLYPGLPYNKKTSVKLRVLFSQMNNLAKKFLAIEGIMNEENQRMLKRFMSGALIWKGLYEEQNNLATQFIKTSLDDKSNYYFYENLVYFNQHISTARLYSENQKPTNTLNSNISLYLIAKLFSQFSMCLNNSKTIEKRYNLYVPGVKTISNIVKSFDIEIFNKEYEEDEFGTKEFIQLYYSLCKTIIDIDDEANLLIALTIYKKKINTLGEAHSIFTRLHNILKERAHELNYEKFGRMNHELSEFILSNESYKDHQADTLRAIAYYSFFEFKYYFLSSEKLKKYIDIYSAKVVEDSRDCMRDYSYAWLYFKEKKYEKSLELISQIQIVDISIKDNIYKLKIAALIELGLFEDTLLTIDAYDHYLNNNKHVSMDYKKKGKNFISAAKVLSKLNTGGTNNHDSEQSIELNKNSVFGKWFKEKFNEMNSLILITIGQFQLDIISQFI